MNNPQSKHYFRGIIGAILGALIGAIPWGTAYYFGRNTMYFMFWLTMLIGFCAIKGYELFGGKIGRRKAWIVLIATCLGLFITCMAVFSLLSKGFRNLVFENLEHLLFLNINSPFYFLIDLFILISDSILMFIFISRKCMPGLVFNALTIYDVFKQAKEHTNLTKINDGHEISEPSFTISYSKSKKELLLRLWLYFAIFTSTPFFLHIVMYTFYGERFVRGWVKPIVYMPIVVILLLFELMIYQKLKLNIEVHEGMLHITSAFRKSQIIYLKDITDLKLKHSPRTSEPTLIIAYKDGKKLFKINHAYQGIDELATLLARRQNAAVTNP